MDQTKKKVAMPADLKLKNRKRILAAFRETGGRAVTLGEISHMTGISRQTIMKSMGFFLEQGMVKSIGKGTSSELGGKRPELYQFHASNKYAVCVRIGHNFMLAAITDLCMNVVTEVFMEHAQNEALEVILEHFSNIYGQLLQKTGISEEQIFAAGISVSGICDQKTGIMRYNSVYPSWGRDIPIVEKFKSRLPGHVKLLISNETKLTAMAELQAFPELKNKRTIVILTHGGGISAAYINKGRVSEGANALAGEIGHMTVDPYSEEQCDCGLKGCLEKVISEQALLKRIKQGLAAYPQSSLAELAERESYRIGDVVAALAQGAEEGDALALEVTDHMAYFMSIGIKNIMLNIDPECIILQGYHTQNGEVYKKALAGYLAKFKYFPDDICEELRYDKREVNELAVKGTGYTLLERYFQEDELYAD